MDSRVLGTALERCFGVVVLLADETFPPAAAAQDLVRAAAVTRTRRTTHTASCTSGSHLSRRPLISSRSAFHTPCGRCTTPGGNGRTPHGCKRNATQHAHIQFSAKDPL